MTILFTDIVGFTAMSQTCQPQEVMRFLHNLFVEFDALVDMDSQLWKVEARAHAHAQSEIVNLSLSFSEKVSVSLFPKDVHKATSYELSLPLTHSTPMAPFFSNSYFIRDFRWRPSATPSWLRLD